MSKKTMKILVTVVTVLMLVLMTSSVVYGEPLKPGDITGATATGENGVDTGEIQKFGDKILVILQSVGAILAVIILVVLGIKYMMGSAEEKADYKKTMIPYLVGAICIFLAPNIAAAIYGML